MPSPLLAGPSVIGLASFLLMPQSVKTVEGGTMRVVQDRAPDSDAAIKLGAEIAQSPPDGFHFWRMELQRSDRGQRTTVRVWFRRDLHRTAPD